MQPRLVLSRRALLGLGALAVVGCSGHAKSGVPPKPAVTPDAAALVTARNGEQALLAAYDARIARTPARNRAPLRVERARHATHLAALHGRPSAASGAPAATINQLLRTSAHSLRSLSLAATDGLNAALLASIAASHDASAG